ncbi:MAG: hypothetical protein A2504_03600 [Bdellovibrionales bacterium RIFOXYD12_FULL_39_22]|nr:MAG: hypothetical protein A2385_11350 [Bdellovibrionales bacterium RIFOXYB1_FULL_39_21]OFZ41664.1 MAG: hypothetical protein A2485_01660 [Bdellovibrionales bacterium RIFOXYC12_FULL_39_17]OFZ46064.1 MAG: hypothetical protein A2404_12025 [Bdellovibrionales bacterium RIFOXYC1_FULL_39_130]OFZ69129.1 MAG: hypothetical protein A2451_14785 [Bdellovibrionales bacterium RIFOXYC2_FULL_39_8]OFZ74891.1 MAG: hypothetical protein A2560_15065 [Bdellovibrionales bacterium RIFOXYD1_FULL_39_84]OFZ92744.1 MAG:
MSAEDKNYYEILELPSNASQKDINEGYQKAKNAYSFDSIALYSIMTKAECDDMLHQIEEAYLILSSPQKRRQYDNAKGFNLDNAPYSISEPDFSTSSGISNPFSQANAPGKFEVNQNTNNMKNITKIVATKRFTLDYEVNPDFEKEIEQTTEFTGSFLKKIREYKQIDIARMSEMTKVSKTYLLNIEDEDMALLPALVYVRGFVYQYAKCLKLNPDLVATSYIFNLKKKQK